MFFLNSRTVFLGKRSSTTVPPSRPSTRLRLEELEKRLTPADPNVLIVSTYTNAMVNIVPNLGSLSVTEIVTATVTAPKGTVLFNLNNQQQTANLNANGQATVAFQLPLLALFAGQTLEVSYQGATGGTSSYAIAYEASTFLAPLYDNFDNVLLPAVLTFNQLTPQQVSPPSNPSTGLPSVLPSFNTAQGETDSFGLITFQYVDPGIINAMTIGNLTFPGIFAFQFGAYDGLTSASSSSSS
jgi:hypothetical protein